MSNTSPLTESEVKALVDTWYARLDVHAPVEELLPLLAEDGLEMRFPEATLRGQEAFTGWYNGVIRKFFDEVHTMKSLDIAVKGAMAKVRLVVEWQARVWDAPARNSVWLGFEAAQTWAVQRSPRTGRAEIITYTVDALTPMPGSAELAESESDTTRRVITTYYDSVNAGDWDTWLTLFDDNVVIDEQLAGHVEGAAILRGAVDGLKAGYSKFFNRPKHIVVEGNTAAVVSHISAANAAGVPIEAEVANYFRVESGKITYMANFHDSVPFAPFLNQKAA